MRLQIATMLLPVLYRGRIRRRYKRFFVEVELDHGGTVTAHCPNTGSMAGCWRAGARVELSHSDDPRRRLPWTLERVDMGAGWIGVHTGRTNAVVAEAARHGRLPGLEGYRRVRREVRVALAGLQARLDLGLDGHPHLPQALIEVKNTTLLDGPAVRFPDAVTVRGRRHLDVLAAAVQHGRRGVILFAVNRPEGEYFAPAADIDPDYARRLREAAAAGVEVMAVRIRHTAQGMHSAETLEVRLEA